MKNNPGPVSGINHVTFSVGNLEQSFRFYREVMGFQPLARWATGAYFLAGSLWVALLLDEKVHSQPLPEYSHVAFSVSPADFPAYSRRLVESGVIIWQENQSEGDSLYFLDPNGHKLEVHAGDWQSRLQSARSNAWDDLEIF